jgi:hypothetical protein
MASSEDNDRSRPRTRASRAAIEFWHLTDFESEGGLCGSTRTNQGRASAPGCLIRQGGRYQVPKQIVAAPPRVDDADLPRGTQSGPSIWVDVLEGAVDDFGAGCSADLRDWHKAADCDRDYGVADQAWRISQDYQIAHEAGHNQTFSDRLGANAVHPSPLPAALKNFLAGLGTGGNQPGPIESSQHGDQISGFPIRPITRLRWTERDCALEPSGSELAHIIESAGGLPETGVLLALEVVDHGASGYSLRHLLQPSPSMHRRSLRSTSAAGVDGDDPHGELVAAACVHRAAARPGRRIGAAAL